VSERTIADDLVDWLVYAPIGAVVTITEDLPGLVEKGRRRMRIVRFAGNVALKVARYRIDSYLDTLRTREPEKSADESEKVRSELEASTTPAKTQGTETRAASPNGAGRHDAGPDASGATTAPASAGNGRHDGARPRGGSRRGGTRAPGASAVSGRGRETAKGAEVLAIPDYDTLAAAQIVKLLPGLSRSELEAVRRHEVAGRSRATILNRIAQLTDGHTPRTRR
jgi:hypothetical protein